jgi:HK97 family phage prohead protease
MKKILKVAFKVKEVAESGIFSGYGSVFGNIDHGGDMVLPDAFEKTIEWHTLNGTMPMMFYGHSTQKENGEWLDMATDDHGLWLKGRLWIDGPNPDPDALKAYRGMKKARGKMGLSIGYDIPEGGAEYIKDGGYWKLKEIDLWEVSVTPFPMNDLARVESVKSADKIKTKREFERFLREHGFSKSAAVGITASGFREQGELAQESELIAMLKDNTKLMEV